MENKTDDWNTISIEKSQTILDALKQMDELDRKLLLVVERKDYFGLLSVGDIQRAIIANQPMDTPVSQIIRDNVRVAHVGDSEESVREMMIQFRTEFMPVLDCDNQLVAIVFWEDVFEKNSRPNRKQIDKPVVIMAGGKGTRLKPFSNILPKPLFPVGEKTISEVILDKFRDAGCQRFFMSVNYKADFIESYFEQLETPSYNLQFFRESKPLGTAGSLKLIAEQLDETFFVSNCDILVETDYSEILDFHTNEDYELTLVAALNHLKIPYGTVQTGDRGRLMKLVEKPELTHLINAGMYVLEPQLLAEIPDDEFFHITQLIEQILARNGKVGVFPVSEKSWSDIGQWNEYYETIRTKFSTSM